MNDEPTDNYTYTCDAGGCGGLTIAIIDTGEHDAGWISMCEYHAGEHFRHERWVPRATDYRHPPRGDEHQHHTEWNPERHLPPELQPCPWVCEQHNRHCNHLDTPPHTHACIFCDTTIDLTPEEYAAIEREQEKQAEQTARSTSLLYRAGLGITAVPGMKEAIKAAANEEQKQAREAVSKRCICPDQPDRFDGQHMTNCPRSMINKGLPVTMFRTNYFSIDDVDDQDVSSPRQPPSKNYASAPSGHRLAGTRCAGRTSEKFPGAVSWLLMILHRAQDRIGRRLDHHRST